MKRYDIVTGGKSPYHIVGANASDACERYAASELQKYLYRATGTFVPYFSDRCPKRGAEIIVGVMTRDASSRVAPEDIDALGEDGFLIRTLGDDILITGRTSRGTLYGVYGFLKKFLGFRAFTKDVEKINHQEEFSIPETDYSEAPDFEYRDAYFRFAFDGAFAAKNGLNSTLCDLSAEKGGSFKFYNCHHSFDDLVPWKKYYAKHPEYYAEIDGKRHPEQLCLSNPDVLKIATEQVFAWIDEHPECRVFSVAQNDNEMFCRCEKCRAVDEEEASPSGSIIRFVNKVAEAAEKKKPDVLIHTFAYQYSRIAPKYARPRENVIVRLCDIECEWQDPMEVIASRDPDGKCAEFLRNLNEWSAITKRLYVWDYAVNFRNYPLPFPCFYQMAKNIRLYRKIGVRGVLQEGNFSYGGGAAMDDLKSYLIGSLLWNADTDTDALIDEFLSGVYGSGAPYFKEYIRILTDAVSGKRMTLYDAPDAAYFTDELIEKCEKLFRLAEEAAENEEIRERIRRERLSIEYLRLTRIGDDAERAAAVDAFAEKVRHFGLTELMERRDLYLSYECIKRSRYAKDRAGLYNLYYIVR